LDLYQQSFGTDAQAVRIVVVVSRHSGHHTGSRRDKERPFCLKRSILPKTAIALVQLL
jgi:hypothetical protein